MAAVSTIAVFLALFGLVIGSFLNVVIYRLPRGLSLTAPRSSCVQCKQVLRACDLFPLVSYLILKGRCRYCGNRISWRYPLVEILATLLMLLSYHFFSLSPLFYKYIVLFYILVIISFVDLEHGLIPNRLVLILLVWSAIWQLCCPVFPLISALIGLAAGGGLFFLIAMLSKGGMGGGDIKLMAVLGFIAGWPLVILVFFLAFILGAVIGLVLLIAHKKTRRDPLPFAPFLALAFLITVFWGWAVWCWYIFYL